MYFIWNGAVKVLDWIQSTSQEAGIQSTGTFGMLTIIRHKAPEHSIKLFDMSFYHIRTFFYS